MSDEEDYNKEMKIRNKKIENERKQAEEKQHKEEEEKRLKKIEAIKKGEAFIEDINDEETDTLANGNRNNMQSGRGHTSKADNNSVNEKNCKHRKRSDSLTRSDNSSVMSEENLSESDSGSNSDSSDDSFAEEVKKKNEANTIIPIISE